MSGHYKFNQLIEKISPERKAKIAQKTDQMKQAIAELQQALQKQTDI